MEKKDDSKKDKEADGPFERADDLSDNISDMQTKPVKHRDLTKKESMVVGPFSTLNQTHNKLILITEQDVDYPFQYTGTKDTELHKMIQQTQPGGRNTISEDDSKSIFRNTKFGDFGYACGSPTNRKQI